MEQYNNSKGREQAVATGGNMLFLVLGWISAILSLAMYPFVFGIVGVIMGVLSTKGQSRGGLPLIVSSIILMGIGLIYSGVIMNYVRHYIGM